jgi:hypothetical protein
MAGKFYVFAEDFCSCLVGPFDTKEEAEAHLVWCRDVRNDGATMEVVSEFIGERLVAVADSKMTPAEDKAWDPAE